MLAELRRQFDQLEHARRELIRKVRRLDAARRNRRPAPGRWSILEELQHLVLAEQRTSLEFVSLPASAKSDPEKLALVLHVLDQDMAVDVPDPGMAPDGTTEFAELVRDWDSARERLNRFLDSVGSEDLRTPAANHPVAGPLGVTDSLRLLAAHFNHHRRRIETAIGPP